MKYRKRLFSSKAELIDYIVTQTSLFIEKLEQKTESVIMFNIDDIIPNKKKKNGKS